MQGFRRRKTKEKLVLFPPFLTIILPISLTFVFVSLVLGTVCAVQLHRILCSLDIFKDPKDHSGRAHP
jgi:hypothetical protein